MENACAAVGTRADCPAGGLADETGWTWPGTGSKHGPPESEGFSLERLEPLRELSEDPSARRYDGPIAGSVVFEYGNAKLASKIASVRQSMLSLVSALEMAEQV